MQKLFQNATQLIKNFFCKIKQEHYLFKVGELRRKMSTRLFYNNDIKSLISCRLQSNRLLFGIKCKKLIDCMYLTKGKSSETGNTFASI